MFFSLGPLINKGAYRIKAPLKNRLSAVEPDSCYESHSFTFPSITTSRISLQSAIALSTEV